MDGIIYWKEGSLSEFSKRPITIWDGRFDRVRYGTYTTRPLGPAQSVNSISIRGGGNPHQVNSINADILRGLHDYAQYIFKPTICNIFLVLPIVQASLRNYQGTNRILSKLKGSTSAQH